MAKMVKASSKPPRFIDAWSSLCNTAKIVTSNISLSGGSGESGVDIRSSKFFNAWNSLLEFETFLATALLNINVVIRVMRIDDETSTEP